MEEAFAAGSPPVGATAHTAALAWTMPGFAAFDTGGADDDNAAEAAPRREARGRIRGCHGRARQQAARDVGGREHRDACPPAQSRWNSR